MQNKRNLGLLEPEVPYLLPDRHLPVCLALSNHLITQVELAAASIDIDLGKFHAEFEGTDVELVADEEDENDGCGKVVLEEALCIKVWTTNGLQGWLAYASGGYEGVKTEMGPGRLT